MLGLQDGLLSHAFRRGQPLLQALDLMCRVVTSATDRKQSPGYYVHGGHTGAAATLAVHGAESAVKALAEMADSEDGSSNKTLGGAKMGVGVQALERAGSSGINKAALQALASQVPSVSQLSASIYSDEMVRRLSLEERQERATQAACRALEQGSTFGMGAGQFGKSSLATGAASSPGARLPTTALSPSSKLPVSVSSPSANKGDNPVLGRASNASTLPSLSGAAHRPQPPPARQAPASRQGPRHSSQGEGKPHTPATGSPGARHSRPGTTGLGGVPHAGGSLDRSGHAAASSPTSSMGMGVDVSLHGREMQLPAEEARSAPLPRLGAGPMAGAGQTPLLPALSFGSGAGSKQLKRLSEPAGSSSTFGSSATAARDEHF